MPTNCLPTTITTPRTIRVGGGPQTQRATGRRNEGLFYAGPALLQKSISGCGYLLKAALLRATGFAAATTDAAKGEAIVRVAAAMLVLSATLPVIAVCFLSRYRISRASHERNLRDLGYAIEGESDMSA